MLTTMTVNRLGGGGAQRSAILLASNWPAEAGECEIVAARGGPYAQAIPTSIPVMSLAPGWPSPPAMLLFILRFFRHLRRSGSRVVVTHVFGLNHLVLALRSMGIISQPVVVVERIHLTSTVQAMFGPLGQRLFVAITRCLYRRAARIIAVSEGVAKDLEEVLRVPRGFISTIHNPIDTDHITAAIASDVPADLERTFSTLPRPITITAGRLAPQKAHCDLLEAFAQLHESERGSLVIFGEGALRGDLERQAEALGVSERVWMPGFVDNPWWFIARAEVFALSSHWEGFGRVLAEAMACGVPVVSTDCPSGPREILAGVPSACLTPVGDTKAMSEAIRALHSYSGGCNAKHAGLSAYDPRSVALQYAEIVAATVKA